MAGDRVDTEAVDPTRSDFVLFGAFFGAFAVVFAGLAGDAVRTVDEAFAGGDRADFEEGNRGTRGEAPRGRGGQLVDAAFVSTDEDGAVGSYGNPAGVFDAFLGEEFPGRIENGDVAVEEFEIGDVDVAGSSPCGAWRSNGKAGSDRALSGGGENFSASFDEVFFACVAVDRVAGEGGEVVRGAVGVVALERLVRQVGDDDVVGGRVHRDLGGFAEGRLAGGAEGFGAANPKDFHVRFARTGDIEVAGFAVGGGA